ncbi:cytochrome b/b6 domain-containing protein [Pseudobdellovibrio exovorus]|uniref:Putative cytochrome b n=1 Tax=Pseudobdellovibrio exovorus JSS TaxID=1184267 RepID=M4VSA1_9BACT|nr:cytochrome b/b6 domain-containing protein [Pseudobdellovibrio exovorus]AGH96069.1 putative cytochrome b [Pseudobdellovibrio exovorus JSS]
MKSSLVYDVPTRLFHWLFAGLFLFSFVVAKTVDDESLIFTYHMLSGLLLGFIVLWRILWGIIGSKYARFSNFSLRPSELKDYFLGILSNSKKRWTGHNPASSWAALFMFALGLGLAVTGYLMTTGHKETYEDLHEFLANAFLVVAILHVAGVVLHSVRHHDWIALSMVNGRKLTLEGMETITSSRRLAGLVSAILVLSVTLFLYNRFDTQSRTLLLFGQKLQLGESEKGRSEGNDFGLHSQSGKLIEMKHDDDDDD